MVDDGRFGPRFNAGKGPSGDLRGSDPVSCQRWFETYNAALAGGAAQYASVLACHRQATAIATMAHGFTPNHVRVPEDLA